MGVIIRGVKNAWRNTLRTVSVSAILALSTGLALVMLLAYRTVQSRIASVRASVGTTITVNPAGARGFLGGGEPLTEAQITTIAAVPHVTQVTATLADRLTTGDTTNLQSAIEAGTLGNRAGQQERRRVEQTVPNFRIVGPNGESNFSFTPPIIVTGVTDPAAVITGETSLKSGEAFTASSTANSALIGTTLATKNNLSVGSTFTAYGQTITVVGIFDAGNQFANSGLYLPLATLQTLAERPGEVDTATVTVDSLEHVNGAVSAIREQLGSETVDVSSNLSAAESALAPLENIRHISLYSLVGALVAGAVITLLIMMMIVRERRREIGVLKAIGASNIGIVLQFVTEALVLTIIGSLLGVAIGVAASNPVLKALVANNSNQADITTIAPGPGGRIRLAAAQFGSDVQDAARDLQTTIGWDILGYGLLAALLIALLGSALPAWTIAKVRPAEVIRNE